MNKKRAKEVISTYMSTLGGNLMAWTQSELDLLETVLGMIDDVNGRAVLLQNGISEKGFLPDGDQAERIRELLTR